MEWHKKLWAWIKILLKMYEKEIRVFVNDMLELAFKNLDEAKAKKLTPALRKKIANKVLADTILKRIDTSTIQGKSEVAKIVSNALDWATEKTETH